MDNLELESLQQLEEAKEFGIETGECGVCGTTLAPEDREMGICFDDSLEVD